MEMVILIRYSSSLIVKSDTDLDLECARGSVTIRCDLDNVNLTLVFLFIKLGQGHKVDHL